MLSPDPTEPASNWDFTAVLDLLRSPTYGDASTPACHPESTAPSDSEGRLSHDVGECDCSSATEVKPKRSYPKLGDFGSLWDLLNRDSTSTKTSLLGGQAAAQSLDPQQPLRRASPVTILKRTPHDSTTAEPYHSTSKHVPVSSASKPRISKDTVSGSSSRSYVQPPAITILERATDKESTPLPPRTPSKPIPGASDTINTPRVKAKSKAKANGKDTESQSEWVSESSAEADSDSSTVIFDSPILKTPGVLAFVPSQVGTQDARTSQDDTPPSSYDGPDSVLNSDIARNIVTTPTGIRVLPAAYKTATERRTGLVTKLIKEFPEYAQHVSETGCSPTSEKRSLEQRPVHVFVDMSNVCFD
jgi:hypothetical protein